MTEKRELLTEAEQKAWEERMRAAGITVVTTSAPSTVTLLRKRPTETAEDERADDSWADDGGSAA
jgi:hypothetical protein